jgi:hypothetical protein
MTPQDFASQLNAAVVEENMATYRSLFINTRIEQASDPYWKRALSLFHELSPEQREILLEIVRQVAVDATANVLGVIDGVCRLQSTHSKFELTCESEELSGDLQGLFLEEAERD